jgi:hypothetical protein
MKERPILFSAEMVRAILDGRKTQTRRVVKPQPDSRFVICGTDDLGFWLEETTTDECGPTFASPYGVPGDRLWVRETWAIRDCGNRVKIKAGDATMKHRLQYVATDEPPARTSTGEPFWWNKRPSIFMPRWASRITLEITGIRVERLEDIQLPDARAEGFETPAHFTKYWDKLHGTGNDTLNPWVWVIEFRPFEVQRSTFDVRSFPHSEHEHEEARA